MSANSLRIANNYISVKMVEPRAETASGIFLPEKSLGRSRWGRVVSVGPGLANSEGILRKPLITENSLVFMFQHGPLPLSGEDEEYGELSIVSEGDVWCQLQLTAGPEGQETSQIIPMGNFVHVEMVEDARQSVTSGGIILPEQAKRPTERARVLAVGCGQATERGGYIVPPVSPGDIVRFRHHTLHTIDYNDLGDKTGKSYLLAWGDVLAVESQTLPELTLAKVETDTSSYLDTPLPVEEGYTWEAVPPARS